MLIHERIHACIYTSVCMDACICNAHAWANSRRLAYVIAHIRMTMNTCMHPAPCIHECIYQSMHPCTHVWIHAQIQTCMRACIHECMHPCIHASMHPSVHACMHESMYPCMHPHPCIHTNIHPSWHNVSLCDLWRSCGVLRVLGFLGVVLGGP